jgi:hypothetical protein
MNKEELVVVIKFQLYRKRKVLGALDNWMTNSLITVNNSAIYNSKYTLIKVQNSKEVDFKKQ